MTSQDKNSPSGEQDLSPEELSQITGGAQKSPVQNSSLSDEIKKSKKNRLSAGSVANS